MNEYSLTWDGLGKQNIVELTLEIENSGSTVATDFSSISLDSFQRLTFTFVNDRGEIKNQLHYEIDPSNSMNTKHGFGAISSLNPKRKYTFSVNIKFRINERNGPVRDIPELLNSRFSLVDQSKILQNCFIQGAFTFKDPFSRELRFQSFAIIKGDGQSGGTAHIEPPNGEFAEVFIESEKMGGRIIERRKEQDQS